jgi:hypothetical protein
MQRLLLALAMMLAPLPALAQTVVDGPLPEPVVLAIAPTQPTEVVAAPSRAELRAMLAERRATHLAELQRYVSVGVFPVNDVQPGYLNVFMDPSGNLCAVANLMSFDGEQSMVQATAMTTNYVRLVDVHEGNLYDWILASGFTQEEIGRIQEPYFYQPSLVDFQQEQQPQLQQQRRLDRERNRLQRTLNRTIARLGRDTERSLDLAVDRLMASSAPGTLS